MDIKEYDVALTFTAPILGTVTGDEEIYKTYIMGKRKEYDIQQGQNGNGHEELAVLPIADELDLGRSVFLRGENDEYLISNHMVRGYLKAACQAMRYVGGSQSRGLTNYLKKISTLVFVEPRFIVLRPSGEMYHTERPLRAQTPQGERTALASSETLPAGTRAEFTLTVLSNEITEAHLREWFRYGRLQGLGQWRNASNGTFSYVLGAGRKVDEL